MIRRSALLLGLALGAALPAQAQSLDAVIAAALDHAPELAAARAREASAGARLDQARAERMPVATLQGQVATGRIDPQGFFGLSADNVTPRSAQFGTELPLFTGGRIAAATAQARAGVAAAQAGSEAVALELRVAVVRAYAGAVAARENANSYGRMVATLAEVRRQAGLRFQSGAGTSTEIAQAEARIAEAEAARAAALGQEQVALATLASLTGMPVQPDATLAPPPPPTLARAAAVEQALAHNPALAAARRMAEMAEAGVRAARAERLPVVGAYAEAATVRDQFFPGYKADSASIGLRARWTLFDGGRTSAKQRGAEADRSEREAQARVTEAMVERQTIGAYEALMSARATYDAATKRVTAAAAALRGVRLEAQTGAQPMLAVLDAERESAAAEAARTAAAADMQVQAQVLASMLGG